MTKYLVCMKQSGEGCNQSIGCGMKYEFINADTVDDVVEKVLWPDGRDEWCRLGNGDGRDVVELVVVPANFLVKVNVTKIRDEIVANAERAELERLQENYKGEDT